MELFLIGEAYLATSQTSEPTAQYHKSSATVLVQYGMCGTSEGVNLGGTESLHIRSDA